MKKSSKRWLAKTNSLTFRRQARIMTGIGAACPTPILQGGNRLGNRKNGAYGHDRGSHCVVLSLAAHPRGFTGYGGAGAARGTSRRVCYKIASLRAVSNGQADAAYIVERFTKEGKQPCASCAHGACRMIKGVYYDKNYNFFRLFGCRQNDAH